MPERTPRELDRERVLVLVKALPHVGDKHGESVCCAGVTIEGNWRRLFPVNFRSLEKDKQFNRWDWIDYEWRTPRNDRRVESRHVQENSIRVLHSLASRERHTFLNRIIRETVADAEERNETLALIRPLDPEFFWERKTAARIREQEAEYQGAASQLSFFANDVKPLSPCPFDFKFRYQLPNGKARLATCEDWETSATFFRLEKRYGEAEALNRMGKIFNQDYPSSGMAFAMGTHSRFPSTWLLVGVIRIDRTSQESFDFGV